MSVLKNSHQSVASQAGLSRLLLQCRFDFQQKSWGLPASEVYRAGESVTPADSAALAAAIGRRLSATVAARRQFFRQRLRNPRTARKMSAAGG